MSLRRWLIVVMSVVVVGGLQVAQHNAIFLQGYAVGESMGRIRKEETEVARLHAQVIGLVSPTHLSDVAQERRLTLVAWSSLPEAATISKVMKIPVARKPTADAARLLHVAKEEQPQVTTSEDTSD